MHLFIHPFILQSIHPFSHPSMHPSTSLSAPPLLDSCNGSKIGRVAGPLPRPEACAISGHGLRLCVHAATDMLAHTRRGSCGVWQHDGSWSCGGGGDSGSNGSFAYDTSADGRVGRKRAVVCAANVFVVAASIFTGSYFHRAPSGGGGGILPRILVPAPLPFLIVRVALVDACIHVRRGVPEQTAAVAALPPEGRETRPLYAYARLSVS